jgi:hypothetical protein
MDMCEDDRKIMIGVGIEGKIEWRLIFVGWTRGLAMNRYKTHVWVCKERVFVGWLLLPILISNVLTDKVQYCTHINNREFFVSCIAVRVDD